MTRFHYFYSFSMFTIILFCLVPTTSHALTSLHGFIVTGDPSSSEGATWRYADTVEGVIYDMAGLLFKPPGTGSFPAIILNHGGGDNVSGAPTTWSKTMVDWGLVCIATNYTHCANVPIGSPGTSSQKGASIQNIMRAHKCRDILVSLGYVDTTRIATHGFSYGAFLTAAFVGAYTNEIRVASHAGGGIGTTSTATKWLQASTIATPYQIHHGDADASIPYAWDVALDTMLQARNIPHELCTYPGYDHLALMLDTTMLRKIRTWYSTHGLFDSVSSEVGEVEKNHPALFHLYQNYPNPFNPLTHIRFIIQKRSSVTLNIFDILGKQVASMIQDELDEGRYDIEWNPKTGLSSGVYFIRLSAGSFIDTKKVVFQK